MPMHAPKPTVATSLPMCFMVSNIARHGTTCDETLTVSERDPIDLVANDACHEGVHDLSTGPVVAVLCSVAAAPRRLSS